MGMNFHIEADTVLYMLSNIRPLPCGSVPPCRPAARLANVDLPCLGATIRDGEVVEAVSL